MENSKNFIPFHFMDREWDARFNVPTDDDLSLIVESIKAEAAIGKFKYCLVSGVEIGERPFQNDYLIKHVHVCLVYNNRVSKKSILKNLSVKEGNGYYLVPRNRSLPYAGWRKHHTKKESKVNPDILIIYEHGELPQDKPDVSAQVTKRSENEKKRKLDEIILELKDLIDEGKDEEAFAKFPRNYLTYGEKIKATLAQKRDFLKTNGDPHIWLYGLPGTGKSALLQVIYPNYYNKNRKWWYSTYYDPYPKNGVYPWRLPRYVVDTKFFDKYMPESHTHVLLQDVDHNSFEKLGTQFFKSLCDEAGYPIDQKCTCTSIDDDEGITKCYPKCESCVDFQLYRAIYDHSCRYSYVSTDKTPQICRLTVLVSSNFHIADVVPEDLKGRNENLVALHRRFYQINIATLLQVLGLKLLNKFEINQLKKQKNTDPRKLFITWDYLRDEPMGEELKPAEHYQQIIRDKYYGL